MPVTLENGEIHETKDNDEVRCLSHGVVTTWGALTPMQRLALEEGIDTVDELPCLLLPSDPEKTEDTGDT